MGDDDEITVISAMGECKDFLLSKKCLTVKKRASRHFQRGKKGTLRKTTISKKKHSKGGGKFDKQKAKVVQETDENDFDFNTIHQ